jgi:hypothetical protein
VRPPLYTEGSPRFYEVVGLFVCGAAATFTLMALVMAGKASSGNSEGTGVRAVGGPVGAGEQGSRDLGDGRGTDSGLPPVLPPEDYARHCDIEPPEGFNRILKDAAEAAKVNPRLMALTVYRESRCDADALGAAGEIGLGQVNPTVWGATLTREGIIDSVDDLYDPEVNLHAVAFILGAMDHMADGDTFDAIRRYNGSGPRARKYAREQSALYETMWGEPAWIR